MEYAHVIITTKVEYVENDSSDSDSDSEENKNINGMHLEYIYNENGEHIDSKWVKN